MKEKFILTLFITTFIGNLILLAGSSSLLESGLALFTAGTIGAMLLGSAMKYFSQEEIDLRDIRRERRLISKGKHTKTQTVKSNKIGVKKFAAKK